jgi:hypothetical protein
MVVEELVRTAGAWSDLHQIGSRLPVRKSVEKFVDIQEKRHSCGFLGGSNRACPIPGFINSLGYASLSSGNSRATRCRSSMVSISGVCSPCCGLYRLTQIRFTSGRACQKAKYSSRYPGRFIMGPVMVQ